MEFALAQVLPFGEPLHEFPVVRCNLLRQSKRNQFGPPSLRQFRSYVRV